MPSLNDSYVKKIAKELSIDTVKVRSTVELLEDGSSVPFISRYRKEATGSLDEVAITSIRDRLKQLIELDKRRVTILQSIEQQGKLTDELREKIMAAEAMAVLEDIYLPFKPKRRTRATVAKEKGLEPLAEAIFRQDDKIDPEKEAVNFVDAEKKVMSTDEALAGARDIIAEWINEDQRARERMRKLFEEKGEFFCKVIKGKEKDGVKYRDYFDWHEPVKTAPSHRILAMRRGEREEFLMLRILPPERDALHMLDAIFVKGRSPSSDQVKMAVADGYKRLLSLSMETEIRLMTKERADKEAIAVFTENLRQLLMASPVGQKNILAVDPGFRTGCKVACLDRQGKLLHHDVIYIADPGTAQQKAGKTVTELCRQFFIEFIAIGNGTASRETEEFIRSLELPKNIQVVMVSENGASIYSASEVAREEFPDHDVTVRGAVSIGRRLMDPLAELVKIDPKSIGVGQYQHDVDQDLLKTALDDVVVSCVNLVGVEINTASKQLLMYVSGIGPTRAQAVIDYRNQQGPLRSREEIKSITGFGPKAFEQAAGFLRIRSGENPLDASAVHPESYVIVEKMAKELGCSVKELMASEALQKRIDLNRYVTASVGLPTLKDIQAELAKPGRDPRQQFEAFRFKEDIQKPEDLKPGMRLPGLVTNITAFGVFIDVGVHLDGLVHISQLSDKFVKNPGDFVKIHQRVMVTVLEVDLERKRIALSMRNAPPAKR